MCKIPDSTRVSCVRYVNKSPCPKVERIVMGRGASSMQTGGHCGPRMTTTRLYEE